MKVMQRPRFQPKSARKAGSVWKKFHDTLGFCMSMPALALKPAPNVGNQHRFQLSNRNLGQMRSQSAFIPFHPELFKVKKNGFYAELYNDQFERSA